MLPFLASGVSHLYSTTIKGSVQRRLTRLRLMNVVNTLIKVLVIFFQEFIQAQTYFSLFDF